MANNKLRPGDGIDKLSATMWNRMVDAVEAWYRGGQTGMSGGRGGSSWDTNFVKVQNKSSADRRRGDILEFTELALTNLDGDIPLLWMKGDKPKLENSFGVLLRAIPQDEFDVCQVAGACQAYVNITDANHKFAYVKKEEYVLQSAGSGNIRILCKPTGTGEKKCGVLLGAAGLTILRGKTQATLTKGSHANVKRYKQGTTDYESPEVLDDVYNELATVGNDKVVYYWQDGDKFRLLDAECPLSGS